LKSNFFPFSIEYGIGLANNTNFLFNPRQKKKNQNFHVREPKNKIMHATKVIHEEINSWKGHEARALLEAWFLMSGEGLDLIDDHALESTWHDGYEIL
jgi:hypothetical protein